MDSNDATNTLAKILAERVTAYLGNPEHRANFENWYFEKYGKKYQWKGEK